MYVFEQEDGGADTWAEVARLTGAPHPRPNLQDGFGHSLSIDGDTVVVASSDPHTTNPLGVQAYAYVFSRDDSGLEPWTLVARLFVQ